MRMAVLVSVLSCCVPLNVWAAGQKPWVVYEGKARPGKGKHIVLIAADDEYRSEELIPALARILAVHHGFSCTVLFAIDKDSGQINPSVQDNIPGLENLRSADLMVIFARFRELPDEQMRYMDEYVHSGKPIIGIRTATHAFAYRRNSKSKYKHYDWRSKQWPGGFGRQVLGETWVAHYGRHNRESTRGKIAAGMEAHPIARGCDDIWGPSDVYALSTLQGDCKPVVLGVVLAGMNPEDPPNRNKPPVPVAWIKTFTGRSGKTARVFATTMGHAGDFKSEGFRRLLVNACYWCLCMEDEIPERAKVDLIGPYEPNPIGIGRFKKGLKPCDLRIK